VADHDGLDCDRRDFRRRLHRERRSISAMADLPPAVCALIASSSSFVLLSFFFVINSHPKAKSPK